MKKKYSLTVANSQIDIITEESKETIDAIVGVVDRKIREVYLHSKGECSRTNAAILVCLDYCAEKLELQKTVKNLNTELEHLTVLNEAAEREKAALERELAALREALSASASQHKPSTRKAHVDQIAFDEMNAVDPTHADQEPTLEIAPKEEPVIVTEKLTPPQEESDKRHVKLKKKKVRAMFDNISFDDI